MYSSLRKQLHYGIVFTEAEEGSSPLTTLHRQNRPGQLPWLYLQLAAHYNAYLSCLRLLVIGHTSSRSITNLYVCVLTASATRRFALLCHGDDQGAGCKWHRWSFYLLYLGAVKFFPAWAFYASIICQNTSAFSLQSALKKSVSLSSGGERERERAFLLRPFFLEFYLQGFFLPSGIEENRDFTVCEATLSHAFAFLRFLPAFLPPVSVDLRLPHRPRLWSLWWWRADATDRNSF